MINSKNYFFSSSLWIANFGVDPTIAILFFLFLPAFFSLKFLLHLVCIVFEAMIISLSSQIKIILQFSPLYLSIMVVIVKMFLLLPYTNSIASTENSSKIKEILISKGEQIEIETSGSPRYSIGNKEVLKHIYIKRKNKLLLKGKSIGFTDLVIWNKNKKTSYHIYVLSKKEQMNQVKLIESLKRTSLDISVQGSLVLINGTVKDLNEYFIIHSILKKKNQDLIFNIKLSLEVRNKIYSKVYKNLYSLGAQKVICFNYEYKIECSIQGLDLKHPQIKMFKKKYSISVQNTLGILKDTNYTASFKIVQVENSDVTNTQIGISKISSPLADLFNRNYVSLIEGEKTFLSQININATLLAEPKTSLVIDQKAQISLGGETPFQTETLNGSRTQWKFYGLKINTILKNLKGRPFLQYNTELTSPMNDQINGSKGKSGIYVSTGKYIKLFEVGYKVTNNQKQGVPILNKIPILKYLFQSQLTEGSYKQIICYVKVEEKK